MKSYYRIHRMNLETKHENHEEPKALTRKEYRYYSCNPVINGHVYWLEKIN